MTGPMTSQGSKIYLSNPAEEEAAIVSVTAAAPAILVSTTAHGAVAGDYIIPHNTDWPSLDEKVFVVLGVATTTLTLGGSDTTDEVGSVTGGAMMDIFSDADDITEIALATVTRDSPAASVLDVTNLSDTSRQQLSGLKNSGTWTAQGFYDPGSPGQTVLRAAYDDGQKRAMIIEPPDGSQILYQTQVNQLSEVFGVDAPVQLNTGGVLNGGVTYIPPAP